MFLELRIKNNLMLDPGNGGIKTWRTIKTKLPLQFCMKMERKHVNKQISRQVFLSSSYWSTKQALIGQS